MRTWTTIRILLALVMTAVLGLSSLALAQEDDSTSDDPTEDVDDDPTDGPSDEASEEDSSDDDDRAGPVTGARVFGADRLSTAVAISQYEFPEAADEVYLARADNFADAVAAGALKRGPVLLVPSCGDLPPVVADEISRLRPRRVVALGGPGAICEDMLNAAVAVAAQAPTGEDGSDDDDDDDPIAEDDPRTEETTFLDLAVGEQATVDAAGAGTVTIERTETGVALVEATPADDSWQVVVEDDEAGEVDVRFRDGTTRVDVDAEVEDGGQVRVRVRIAED